MITHHFNEKDFIRGILCCVGVINGPLISWRFLTTTWSSFCEIQRIIFFVIFGILLHNEDDVVIFVFCVSIPFEPFYQHRGFILLVGNIVQRSKVLWPQNRNICETDLVPNHWKPFGSLTSSPEQLIVGLCEKAKLIRIIKYIDSGNCL